MSATPRHIMVTPIQPVARHPVWWRATWRRRRGSCEINAITTNGEPSHSHPTRATPDHIPLSLRGETYTCTIPSHLPPRFAALAGEACPVGGSGRRTPTARLEG